MTVSESAGNGVVEAIYVSPARKIPMKAVEQVEAAAGKGLVGDRYHGSKHRHVSVQSREDIAEASRLFEAPIAEDLTRRNVTVSGINIPTRPGERLAIGEINLEVVRIAAPCKLLDDDIGVGAKTALRRRAGTIFRILTSGTISVGDTVVATEQGASSRA